MKVCANCCRSNDDSVERCIDCGGIKFEAVVSIAPIDKRTDFNGEISSGVKSWLWWGAWGVLILFYAITNPSNLAGFYAFPLGLLAWFPRGVEWAIEGLMFGAWVIGWFVYILIAITVSHVKKRGLFFLVYAVFCILLILNVVGCQRIIDGVAEIH